MREVGTRSRYVWRKARGVVGKVPVGSRPRCVWRRARSGVVATLGETSAGASEVSVARAMVLNQGEDEGVDLC